MKMGVNPFILFFRRLNILRPLGILSGYQVLNTLDQQLERVLNIIRVPLSQKKKFLMSQGFTGRAVFNPVFLKFVQGNHTGDECDQQSPKTYPQL